LNVSSQANQNRAVRPDIAEHLGARKLRLIKRWIAEVNGPFDALIARYVTESSSILDAGSGRGDPDLPTINQGRVAIACDPDVLGLKANEVVRLRAAAFLETLPFANDSIDIIVCKFVIEHLQRPLETFREFFRVLRPGGVLALLTPNRFSLFVIVARLIPFSLKQRMKRNLFGGHDEDTFPAHYRANTISDLSRQLTEAGFQNEHTARLAGLWAFFLFATPAAMAVRALERFMLHIPGLRNGSTHIMAAWRKPAGAAA
jgi:SAM-dependent methyltransferase